MSTPDAAPGGPSGQDLGRPPTIYDVARVAGVSHQTVSRFLKGDSGIRPKNHERVTQALNALGYRPNLTARSLATRQAHRVAVLIQALDQLGPARILQGVILEARAAGYLLDIVTVDATDRAALDEAIRAVTSQHIAGIVTLASSDEMTDAFTRAEFRVPVLIHTETEDSVVGAPEHLRGLHAIVDHLVGLGHRRFFHIGGPPSWVASRNREHAYLAALERHGLTSLGTAHGDWSAPSGYSAAQTIPREAGVTAVVCANDQMAIGAMRALTVVGRRIPLDVSVTGIDDIPEAAYVQPPLTTVRLAFEQQGRRAFRRLLAQLGGAQELTEDPPAQLVVRASTGAAPLG
ncbi:MAG TPA: LacI family DNA-binding transcriptional regulator [Gryllotalpicola sp.]